MQFLKKIFFEDSYLENSEKIQLCELLGEKKHCYSTHCNAVAKNSPPLLSRLEPDAKLQTQRPTEILIHNQVNMKSLLNDLQNNGVVKQIGSTPQEKPIDRSTFLKPLTFKKIILSNLC